MIHWGINALNHGSSLAVFENDKLIANTVSADDNLSPTLIRQSLEHGGAPDRIFWYENPWLKKARQIYAGQYSRAFDTSSLPKHKLREWGLGYAPLTYTPHHASHAAAGYYTSPFDHCAVVVLDAIGEFECATIWEGKNGELKKVWSRNYPNSLGLFYSAFTDFLGLTPIKDEHVLQQMAEKGDARKWLFHVRTYFEQGQVLRLNANFHRGVLHWDHNNITSLQEQCDLAAAVQVVFEEQVDMIMIKARSLTGSENLVYMGGCAMNSTYNKQLTNQWQYIWSLPQPGDPSSSIGAVLYHTKQRIRNDFGVAKHIEVRV